MSCPILVVNTGATDFANANVPVSIVVSEYTNLTLADFIFTILSSHTILWYKIILFALGL